MSFVQERLASAPNFTSGKNSRC